MLGLGNQTYRRKRESQYIKIKKSPYFSSIRRKSKFQTNQALSITKYQLQGKSQKKKKVFKRMGKFVDMDSQQANQLKKQKSCQKNIVNSIKTLSLLTKYQSYKSIPITPKIKDRQNKSKKFRTKTRSGNSIILNKQNNDDWLSKQVIKNEVYGTQQDFDS